MRNIIIKTIKLYQKIPGPWHNACRHVPTCSNYAIEALEVYGTIKGGKMACKRILRCNPWGTSGYDPVIKEEKNEKNN